MYQPFHLSWRGGGLRSSLRLLFRDCLCSRSRLLLLSCLPSCFLCDLSLPKHHQVLGKCIVDAKHPNAAAVCSGRSSGSLLTKPHEMERGLVLSSPCMSKAASALPGKSECISDLDAVKACDLCQIKALKGSARLEEMDH